MKLTQTNKIIIGVTGILTFSILYLIINEFNYHEGLSSNNKSTKCDKVCKRCEKCGSGNVNNTIINAQIDQDYSKYENNEQIPVLNMNTNYTLNEIINTTLIIYHKYNYIIRQINRFFINKQDRNNIIIIMNKLDIVNNSLNIVRNYIQLYTSNTPNIQDILNSIITIINSNIQEYNNILKVCDSKDSMIIYISTIKN